MDRIIRATINTWNGLLSATRSEPALRQELIAIALAAPLVFVVANEAWKRWALIAVVLLVIVAELLNTAVEKLSDHVTPTLHVEIGHVKDIGSASVGVTLVIAGVTWLLAIAERLGLL